MNKSADGLVFLETWSPILVFLDTKMNRKNSEQKHNGKDKLDIQTPCRQRLNNAYLRFLGNDHCIL